MTFSLIKISAEQTEISRVSRVTCLLLMFLSLAVSLPSYADGFHLELAYCDLHAGPLTFLPDGKLPLSDGCLIQIIEHVSEGIVPPPDANGNPGEQDRLLVSEDNPLRTDGLARLQMAGYLLIDPALDGMHIPVHPLYVRIWNAPDPVQATYYYETPLYVVIPGAQQINYAREQLVVHGVAPSQNTIAVLPTEFNTLASYPNPFNAKATLTYVLEQSAHVMVDLYNIQGRKAAELTNGEAAAGSHDIHFNAADFSTGTYVAVLRVNGAKVSTHRMTLLK